MILGGPLGVGENYFLYHYFFNMNHTSSYNNFMGQLLLVLGTEGVLSFCGDIGLASKLQAVSQNLMMQGLGWS